MRLLNFLPLKLSSVAIGTGFILTNLAIAQDNSTSTMFDGPNVNARFSRVATLRNYNNFGDRILIAAPGAHNKLPNQPKIKDAGMVVAYEWDNNTPAPGYVEVFRHYGEAEGDALGSRIFNIGDITGDNQEDFAVASVHGSEKLEIISYTGQKLFTLQGNEAEEESFGQSVISIDDRDGDGLRDLAVGASQATCGGGETGCSGKIYIISSKTRSTMQTIAFSKPDKSHRFGHDLVELDDYTKDGIREIAVGAPGATQDEGNVWIIETDGTYVTDLGEFSKKANAEFGYSISAADITGNGKKELIVASPFETVGGELTGRVRIFDVKDVNTVYQLQSINVDKKDSRLGKALTPLKYDNDEYMDLAIGAPGYANEDGAVFIYRGTKTGLEFVSMLEGKDKEHSRFGRFVATAYLDKKVKQDLIVGAPLQDFKDQEDAGVVSTYSLTDPSETWHVTPLHPGTGTIDLIGVAKPYENVMLTMDGLGQGNAILLAGSTLLKEPIVVSDTCKFYIGNVIDNLALKFAFNGPDLKVPVVVPNTQATNILLQLVHEDAGRVLRCTNVLEVGTQQ